MKILLQRVSGSIPACFLRLSPPLLKKLLRLCVIHLYFVIEIGFKSKSAFEESKTQKSRHINVDRRWVGNERILQLFFVLVQNFERFPYVPLLDRLGIE